jgi:invasion protein IalB
MVTARSIGMILLLAGCSAALAAADTFPSQAKLSYTPWTKFCHKGEDATAGQICFTGKDGRAESGVTVIGAVIIEPAYEPKKILRVTVPLGMQLAHGTRVIIDNNPPQRTPYVVCFDHGCESDYEATPELIANLKKGLNLIVQAINSDATVLTWALPLADFAKAYSGPPIDLIALEDQRKSLEKRALRHDDTLEPQYRPQVQ